MSFWIQVLEVKKKKVQKLNLSVKYIYIYIAGFKGQQKITNGFKYMQMIRN